MNREYKSDVFSMLMHEPKYALQLYNTLNHSNYTDESLVKMISIRGAISLSMENDASFVVNADISFLEHQSTYNPNMPLRSVLYFASAMRQLTKNQDLYGRKVIKIPRPHFVTFYNGLEKRPAKEIQRLSDAFEVPSTDVNAEYESGMELTCLVYNINAGYNENIKDGCEVLKGYSAFVDMVREFHKDLPEGEANLDAVTLAVDQCIEQGILEGFLRKHREEVIKMAYIDMTWEVREPLIRRDSREEGREEGRRELIRKALLKMNAQEVADLLGQPIELVQSIQNEV